MQEKKENKVQTKKPAGEKKPKWLPHNKTWFKKLLPRTAYLNDIRIGQLDIPFLVLIMVLLVFGLIMMYSASYAWAIHKGVAANYYFNKQLGFAAVGTLVMLFVASPAFDYHILKNKYIVWAFFIFCASLLIVTLVIGKVSGGAQRWLEIGGEGGFTIQPSEFMKLALIIVFAHMISSNYSNMKTFGGGILPYAIILGIVAALLIAQPHFSATVIVGVIGLSLIFVGGADSKQFVVLVILGICLLGAVGYGLYMSGFEYIKERIDGWLYTFDENSEWDTWQTRNSLIAIGSGGIWGLGLGNSRQKFLYLPESQNDFVFSIVCEELGFVGACVVIILFLMLIFRGFYIADNAPDKFGMILAVGIVVQIGIQALFNIAVVTNSIPNTGISLPFFSYGGTALGVQLAEMGIVLNISRQSIPKKKKSDADEKELRKIQEAKDTLAPTNKKRSKG